MALPQEKPYTIDDIYALPDGKRAELIDGRLYMMAPPNTRHQEISGALYYQIRAYISRQKGECKIYAAPFAVFLFDDNENYVEPDLCVICDKEKIGESGCHGAPDWVIEITSSSTQHMDYGIKLFKYRMAGVREYWIINPKLQTVNVFNFEQDAESAQYSFEDKVPVYIYKGFQIRLADSLL